MVAEADTGAVRWIDSGLELHCSRLEADQAECAERTLLGILVSRDDRRMVLAMDIADDGSGTYGIVWTPCVLSVKVLG